MTWTRQRARLAWALALSCLIFVTLVAAPASVDHRDHQPPSSSTSPSSASSSPASSAPSTSAPASTTTAPTPTTSGQTAEIVPPSANSIPGRYIVTLKPESDPDATANDERAKGHGVDEVYRHALKGFTVTLTSDQVTKLAKDPRVARIEPDGIVTASATEGPLPSGLWGLDRIDQRFLPLDTNYTYTPSGAGVKAYVIDTGIRTTHTEFGGRAIDGADFIDGSLPAADCNGHGTHVAGTIGGATYGVAKDVTLVAVRVLDCNGSGSYSQVIAGIDWVTGNHLPGQPAVANMSLGGGFSQALNNAVANSVADGVVYAIAAGNSSADACSASPASEPSALTVGATGSNDARASFSNYGNCVDVFAPGVSVLSAWGTSDSATNTISGTSMATPHVTGRVALYLQDHPSATPAQVSSLVVSSATGGVVSGAGAGSPNLLLYTGDDDGPPPPPPPPPPANDPFAGAFAVGPATGNTTGDNTAATKQAGEPDHAGNSGGHSLWYTLTPPANGSVTIDTVGSNFDTLLGVYKGSAVGSLTLVAANDDGSGIGVQSRVSFTGVAGTPYRIAVDGWNGASGAVKLNWTTVAAPPTTTSSTTTPTTAPPTTTTSTTTTTTTSTTTTTTTLPPTTTTAPPTTTTSTTSTTTTTTTGPPSTTTTTTTLPPPSNNTGWKGAGQQAAQPGGDGNGYEVNSTNLLLDDGAVATDTNSGTTTSTDCASSGKDKHAFRNYGFALPGGSVVKGIEVQLHGQVDSTVGSPQICVMLSWNGGNNWTVAKATPTLGTTDGVYTLGGVTDTWGRSWSLTNISNSSFRVRIANVASDTSRDFSLDWVGVRISY